MEALAALGATLADWPLAETMRRTRWGYAAASTGHVAGIALLVGALVPFDLRLLGAWASVERAVLARVLLPVAAAGLALAVSCGVLLFLAAPADYLGAPLFLAKMALVAAGLGQAAALHLGPGLAAAGAMRLRVAGALSLVCWTGALVAGRMLAFVGE
ncbi:hypothetical protein [Thiocapsa bogorovii]|uniref:hypothetical protein n=1 Tax=Thiocapsa bogorovii TaxID=521689 RepID=UPI001E53F06E|nr:hypothetical protein [Thiocapsa bogorovii]UHD18490.1 hypothetical protein LT988_10860 [Thiocapsa bogorovii]